MGFNSGFKGLTTLWNYEDWTVSVKYRSREWLFVGMVRTSVRSKYSDKNVLPLLTPSSLQQARPEGGYVVWAHLNIQLFTLQICTSQGTQAATLPRAWHFKLRINWPNLCYWRITRKKKYFFCFIISMYTIVTLDIIRAMRSKRMRWVGHVAHRP